jgi:hypothetical protein
MVTCQKPRQVVEPYTLAAKFLLSCIGTVGCVFLFEQEAANIRNKSKNEDNVIFLTMLTSKIVMSCLKIFNEP